MATAPVAQENKVVLMSAQGAAVGLTKAGDYIFRVFPSDTLQGPHLAKLAISKGYKKVPVMYINNDWAWDSRTPSSMPTRRWAAPLRT